MSDRAVNARVFPRPGPIVAALTAAGLALAGCEGRRAAEPPAPETAPPPPATPAVDPVLDRAALLAALDAAASDAAAGRAPPADAPSLANRRFRMRIAFGCQGPTPVPPAEVTDAGSPAWSRAPDGQTIRLRFSPEDWTRGGPAGAPVEGFESVGGVWINQPWMRAEGCPVAGPPVIDAAAAPESSTAALALLRAEGASRLGAAGERAFAFTVRGEGGEPAADPTDGYRLVLEGRLAPWADGRVIRCGDARPVVRPTCVAGVVLERLAFEDGATGAMLSEWRPG